MVMTKISATEITVTVGVTVHTTYRLISNSQKVFSYTGSDRTTAIDTASTRYILLIFS